MADRILSGALIIASVGLIYLAFGYNPAFLNEPIGPRAYPIAVLTLIIILSGFIFLSPKSSPEDESGGHTLKIALASLAMLAYAYFFEHAGYLVATTLFALVIGKITKGRTLPTLAAGIVMSVLTYLMFAKVLQVSLPLGLWLRGLMG